MIIVDKMNGNLQKQWKLFQMKKDFVETVKLLIGSIDRNGSMDNQTFVRPVNKVVLQVESGKGEWWCLIPNKGAMKPEVNIYHDYLERNQLYMDFAATLVVILK